MRQVARAFSLLACGFAATASAAATWEKINPTGFNTVNYYCIDSKGVLTIAGGRTFWSDDAGKKWNEVTSIMKVGDATAVAMSSSGFQAGPDGEIYAIWQYMIISPLKIGGTLFVTKDHGATWTTVLDSIPGFNAALPNELRVAPNGDMYLRWAALGFNKDKLMVSKDKGKTWNAIAKFTATYLLETDPDNQVYTVARSGNKFNLYRSADQGGTWDSLYNFDQFGGNNSPNSLAANRKGSVLIGSTDGGFTVKTPALDSFTSLDRGKGNVDFGVACTFSPEGKAVVAAVIEGIAISDASFENLSVIDTSGISRGASLGVAREGFVQYDASGNLIVVAGQDIFVMRGSGNAIRPRLAGSRSLLAPARFDLQGRSLPARTTARAWRVAR